MARGPVYAAIDVGTTKVCTLVGQVGVTGEVQVTGVGVVPARGLLKGMVVNIDDAAEAIRLSVERAERTSGSRITSAHVGITGAHIDCLNNRGMVTITRSDRLVSVEDVSRVMEAARAVGIPNNREILHVLPRSYVLDGQEGVRNPVGLYGFKLDVEAHIITGAITSIHNLTRCVELAGVAVEELVLEPLASAEAVLVEDEREMGVALVDIGGGTTDLAVFIEGGVAYTAVLPIGGYQFTHDLVIGLRAPFAAAEEAKVSAGSVEPAAIPVEEQVEIEVFGEGGKRPVSRRLMSEILRARTEELLELLHDAIRRSGYSGLLPAGMVFTGGTANLAGLPALAEQTLHIPARVGLPEGVYGLVDTLHNPAYATSVGLLLWAVRFGADQERGQSGFALAEVLQNLLSWLKVRT